MYKYTTFTQQIGLVVLGERIDSNGQWKPYHEHRCVYAAPLDYENTVNYVKTLATRADFRGLVVVASVTLQPIPIDDHRDLNVLFDTAWGPPMTNSEMFSHLTEVLRQAEQAQETDDG